MSFSITSIVESEKVIEFLEKRNLLQQYKKAKNNILQGLVMKTFFGYRKPKQDGILYFRINKQFRAWGELNENTLVIFRVDNHQK